MGRKMLTGALALVTVVAGISCGGGTGSDASMGPTTGAEGSATTLSTPEIAGVAVAIATDEIAQAQLAVALATNTDVKKLAAQLAADYTQALQGMQGLETTDSTTSSLMQQDAQKTTSELQSKSGAAFDLAYASAQVTTHQKVLALLDQALLPNVASNVANDANPQANSDIGRPIPGAGYTGGGDNAGTGLGGGTGIGAGGRGGPATGMNGIGAMPGAGQRGNGRGASDTQVPTTATPAQQLQAQLQAMRVTVARDLAAAQALEQQLGKS